MKKMAVISDCGLYRYLLTRVWDDNRPILPFIMLNPSTADAELDDPTIRRCISFAQREKFGGIAVGNLYAFRTPSPKALFSFGGDKQGPQNEGAIQKLLTYYGQPIICAWGAHPLARSSFLVQRALSLGTRLACLGKTAEGHPRHPLYVKGDQPLVPFP